MRIKRKRGVDPSVVVVVVLYNDSCLFTTRHHIVQIELTVSESLSTV